MQIPQDPDRHPLKNTAAEGRRESTESIDLQLCDGPVEDDPVDDVPESHNPNDEDGGSDDNICTDRAELIERIKRGESPTWVPNKALEQEYIRSNNGESPQTPRKAAEPPATSPLLPPAELQPAKKTQPNPACEQSPGFPEIVRPRSTLHARDFTANHADDGEEQTTHSSSHGLGLSPDTLRHGPLGTSPTTPWYTPPTSLRKSGASHQSNTQDLAHNNSNKRPLRDRAPSLNSYHSSNYVLKAPTTPLVQQSNNTDLDFPPRDPSLSPEKRTRRRTLPPHSFDDIHSAGQWPASSTPASQSPSHRREATFPSSHQHRRSLTSNWSLQASNSPQTPAYSRSRRTSSHSEASPLQHASMVGSYEESILRGWMSTAPSKPLYFTARIGVLGRNNCKPKCPPHITIQFPAVYYNWSAGNGRSAVKDEPSPYVGHIDLHQIQPPAETKESSVTKPTVSSDCNDLGVSNASQDNSVTENVTQIPKKRRRASPSARPPRGSYRIPQQGQLQIIIKNPDTAVKPFLVPYDLEDMGPGTKTFVRQRAYLADPVIEDPHSQKDSGPASRKSTLRYLIHLNICSPSKGRFYLYHQVRVVFPNRVPDNKEQLRNEIQLPQPRFSPWKPRNESLLCPSSSSGVKIAAEKAYHRRSSGFAFGTDELDSPVSYTFSSGSMFSPNSEPIPPIPPIPFSVTMSRQKPTSVGAADEPDPMELDKSRPPTSDDAQSPLSDKSNRPNGAQLSSSFKSSSSQGSDGYGKLNKGESGYGGLFGRPGTPEPGEGLLARKLKGLGVQRDI